MKNLYKGKIVNQDSMATEQKHSPFGVGVIAFVLAVSVSIAFLQFAYLPYVTAKPKIPEEVLHPSKIIQIMMVKGSTDPSQQDNFIPKRAEVQLGLDNKVIWTNEDETAHTVTSDNDAVDKYSGPFNSLETIGVVPPGKTFEFLFTQEGEFPYHCEPHPWMKGLVKVIKPKF